jgi:hypothetical protein
MINVTSRTGRTGLRAARFATESSASFATIAAARHSVQPGASNVLSSAGRATAAGYGDLELHEYTSKRSEREFPALGSFAQGAGVLNMQCAPTLWTCMLWLVASCGMPHQALAQDATLHEHGQAERRHPPEDMALHEKFYSTWHMPDNPAQSCCNNADCYPTDIRYVDGKIYAKRREDGKYILIPPQKVERNRDNPDGRNHLCAPPPGPSTSSDTVYCFALGGAT